MSNMEYLSECAFKYAHDLKDYEWRENIEVRRDVASPKPFSGGVLTDMCIGAVAFDTGLFRSDDLQQGGLS